LASNPALEVVGRASATATLAPQVAALQPDVVVVELEGHDDPATTAMLGEVLSAAATVVLADDPRGTWAAEALRTGARAILPREATADEIVGAVEAAAAGLVVLHPAVADTLLPLLSTPARAVSAPPAQQLTPREIEVLGMLAEGLGNKTIARRLGISEHTVKFHVGSILAKLDASSRTEAVTLGARRGLIML
jgi:DNA-binding NarL/FixJ family response regulator